MEGFFSPQFRQHEKPQPSADNEDTDNQIDEPILPVPHKAVGKDGKAGIAKGAYGVKYSEIQGINRTPSRKKSDKEQECTHTLYEHGEEQHVLQKRRKASLLAIGQGVLDDQSPDQRRSLACQQEKQGGKGHDTQSSRLDKKQNHTLSEQGVGLSGIHHRETRHATRGRGRKKGIDQADALSGGRCRKGEQYRSRTNQGRERKNGKPGRRVQDPPPELSRVPVLCFSSRSVSHFRINDPLPDAGVPGDFCRISRSIAPF